ncbi:8-amino-7-oxononanoate synthase [Ferrimonas gelatinilytica]|uniref:8-amino-7-oxononanoate synthase n=1 Tax=Ferrimonas gelatinilytica TaxID=1255257 RepID=A0ABP9SEM0_9GAMM
MTPLSEPWQSRAEGVIQERQAQDLLRRRRCVEFTSPRTLICDGRTYLQFASNDYLGLAFDDGELTSLSPERTESARRRGAGGSALICGYQPAHQRLEQALCEATGFEAALLFSSGFAANAAPFALCRAGDRILADKLVHASVVDGAQASEASLRRFPHNDMATLTRWLEASDSPTMVVSESVFSMDGDQAPMADLVALCRRHGALSWLDDAHGFGVIGKHGLGASELARPDLLTITFGKALGASGAALLGSRGLIEAILQSARHYIFSTAMPVDLADHLVFQLKRAAQPGPRQHLADLIAHFRRGARAQGWSLLDSETPIQPLVLGGSDAALALSAALEAEGIWCPAIRPPTVPRGQARLRIVFNAGHRAEDVDRLLTALAVLGSKP